MKNNSSKASPPTLSSVLMASMLPKASVTKMSMSLGQPLPPLTEKKGESH